MSSTQSGKAMCQTLPVLFNTSSSSISAVGVPRFKSSRVNSTRLTAVALEEYTAKFTLVFLPFSTRVAPSALAVPGSGVPHTLGTARCSTTRLGFAGVTAVARGNPLIPPSTTAITGGTTPTSPYSPAPALERTCVDQRQTPASARRATATADLVVPRLAPPRRPQPRAGITRAPLRARSTSPPSRAPLRARAPNAAPTVVVSIIIVVASVGSSLYATTFLRLTTTTHTRRRRRRRRTRHASRKYPREPPRCRSRVHRARASRFASSRIHAYRRLHRGARDSDRRTMSRAWSFMVLTIGYCNVLYDVFARIINNVERTRRRATGLCAAVSGVTDGSLQT